MKTFLFITIIALFLLAPISSVQAVQSQSKDIDFSALDSYVLAQMEKHALPGAALAVVQGDVVIYQKGYGKAGSSPVTPQTKMMIGSQSKSFTALAVAQLIEAGKVELNASVQTYIPWFQVADEKASSKITVKNLLHHTSGLSEAGFSVVLPDEATPEDAVRALSQAQLSKPVGTKFQYFNLNYSVLAYLVETVSGQSYASYLQEKIFTPLGMISTSADPSAAGDLDRSYTRLFGFPVPMKQPVRVYGIGAGYIVSTAEDMARYAAAMNNGGELGSTRLISTETARILFTPWLDGYAMGWMVAENGQKIFHGGANETFGTDVNLYPKHDLAFVLMINEGHLVDHYLSIEQLTVGVEAILLGQTPPAVSQGWSVKILGWGIGALVLALLALNAWNFYRLFHGWKERMSSLTPLKKGLDVAISFIIPTVILLIVFIQMQSFFGYRFNLLTNLAQFRFSLPDIFILMLVGSVFDYIQGIIKVGWILAGKTSSKPVSVPAYS